MTDLVSIELLLDPETELQVRADWERLAAAGLSSLAPHRSPSNRPHITLLVRPTLDAVDLAEIVALLPVTITLGEPIVFPHGDRGVLVRPVVPTEQLSSLHRALHGVVPPGEDAAHTTPGDWTPHVSLARRLKLASLPDALRVLGPEHAGTGVALRRWDSGSATVTILT